MLQPGSPDNPLRVAIVGAGPAGFYAADALLKAHGPNVTIHFYDRLPTPFGLVRFGVAPDHQKIKSVTKLFERILARPNVRFFGNVGLGRDVNVEDLRRFYHQILYSVGAQTDRKLNIPGIDLEGSHAATEFVAWYNGHPEFRDRHFDLSAERVAVIGVGNVAMDVARILAKSYDELAVTDIADHALEALRRSKVREIFVLGRRGPAQAAFTPPEIKELGELDVADVRVLPEEMELDPLSAAQLEQNPDKATLRKLEILREYAARPPQGKPRTLTIRFLVSPVELLDDGSGRVKAMRLVRNELYATAAGTLRPRPTQEYEILPVDLVFRSIGYRGLPIPGVPFNESWGVILNDSGRVLDEESGQPRVGEYTAGWIKRGPSGVIGTNKPDAVATVKQMLADLEAGKILEPTHTSDAEIEAFLRERQPHIFNYQDWKRLDALEVARGREQGRPRVKFTSVEEMLAALGR